MTVQRKGVLETLQLFRGVAACFVVLYHAGPIFADPQFWGRGEYRHVFDFGGSGVAFFFVLSGFIIFHAHRRDIGNPARLGRYLWRRAIRIYPAYWVASLGKLALLIAFPAVAVGGYSAIELTSSFTLLPFAGMARILAVAWTLFHEILFYTLFAILIWNRRAGIALFAGWFLLILVHAPLPVELTYVVEPLNLLFMIGIAVFEIDERFKLPYPLVLGLASSAAFMGLSIMPLIEPFQTPLLGLATGGLILGFVQAEKRGQVVVPRPLLFVGAASYSIYLVHAPLQSIIAKVLARLHLQAFLPAPVVFILFVACCVGAGLVFYVLVERPLLRLLQRKRETQVEVAAAPLPAATESEAR